MKKLLVDVCLPVVLGLLFPMILFSSMSKFLTDEQTKPQLDVSDATSPLIESAYSTVCIKMDNGVIQKMPLESYVLAVVLREMPADFHPEALKAQAVVARTGLSKIWRSF